MKPHSRRAALNANANTIISFEPHVIKAFVTYMWAEFAHLKGSLSAQTLEHDGSDAPQVGLGVVVL